MNQKIPITVWFEDKTVVGNAEIESRILEMFARGDYVIAPSYIKHPDGRIEITSLSMIPADQVMTHRVGDYLGIGNVSPTAPVTKG
jgi:hypothetical protein